MIRPICRRELDRDTLEKHLRGMIDARVALLPAPLRSTAGRLLRAESSDAYRTESKNLVALGLDWSRAGPIVEGWNAHYCDCVFCGESVASKKGISDHLANDCEVLSAIKSVAHTDFCKTPNFFREVVAKQEEDAARGRMLCVVDLAQGQEYLQTEFGYGRRKDLGVAELRLKTMGFTKSVAKLPSGGTETRWEKKTSNAYVLADPRHEGRIYIRAWPLGHNNKPLMIHQPYHAPEYILDGWRRDLDKKLKARIDKQLAAALATVAR